MTHAGCFSALNGLENIVVLKLSATPWFRFLRNRRAGKANINMSDIDSCEIPPQLQGGSFFWKGPRVETMGWHPAAPSEQRKRPKASLTYAPF
jgi:hypothetical protein